MMKRWHGLLADDSDGRRQRQHRAGATGTTALPATGYYTTATATGTGTSCTSTIVLVLVLVLVLVVVLVLPKFIVKW
jgi:ABC-type transporter Mla maintaining outer membrane lipid asymmetry permease subunit MlaE